MRTINNGGDQLARGAVKATFRPADNISDEKWASIFDDFDPEEYRKKNDTKLDSE